MPAQLLDGKKLADSIKEQLRDEVVRLKKETGGVPVLVNVITREDRGASRYSQAQEKAAAHIGITYQTEKLSDSISQAAFIERIEKLNTDTRVNGVLLHKPVPEQIDYRTVANRLSMAKDVEGINATNIGKMMLGGTQIIPCTPAAVMAHILSTGVSLRGKEAVIVGHSEIVGKPLSLLLLDALATVTVCHIGTSDAGKLCEHVERADILVVAVGKAGLISGEWIRQGAVVIDVGINQVGDAVHGDIVFETAQKRAGYITPVPGGVGPVTVIMLMKNCIAAYKQQMAQQGG